LSPSHSQTVFFIDFSNLFLAIDVFLIDVIDAATTQPATGAVFASPLPYSQVIDGVF
jgi:predicted amidohydrolase